MLKSASRAATVGRKANLFSMDHHMSPTSMLEHSKDLACNTLDASRPNLSHSCNIGRPVTGLAGVLVGAEEECRKKVLFGLHLKVQLPPKKGFGDLPRSPIEFGVKNREAQLALLSSVQRSPLSTAARAARSEVELCEDYTCVIARGPNPRTTHIFEDCVVESCGGGGACCSLSCCYGCKKRLGHGKDVLTHRGKKAFCSSECRYQDMLLNGNIGESPDSPVAP